MNKYNLLTSERKTPNDLLRAMLLSPAPSLLRIGVALIFFALFGFVFSVWDTKMNRAIGKQSMSPTQPESTPDSVSFPQYHLFDDPRRYPHPILHQRSRPR